jgi:hypothetical protein
MVTFLTNISFPLKASLQNNFMCNYVNISLKLEKFFDSLSFMEIKKINTHSKHKHGKWWKSMQLLLSKSFFLFHFLLQFFIFLLFVSIMNRVGILGSYSNNARRQIYTKQSWKDKRSSINTQEQMNNWLSINRILNSWTGAIT